MLEGITVGNFLKIVLIGLNKVVKKMIVFTFLGIVVFIAYFIAVCAAIKNMETYMGEDDDD